MNRPNGFEKIEQRSCGITINNELFRFSISPRGDFGTVCTIDGKAPIDNWTSGAGDILWIKQNNEFTPSVRFGEWIPIIYIDWKNNSLDIAKVKVWSGMSLTGVASGIKISIHNISSIDNFTYFIHALLTVNFK